MRPHNVAVLVTLALLAGGCTDHMPVSPTEASEALQFTTSECALGVPDEDALTAIAGMLTEVNALEAAGVLNAGQARALRNHLENARRQLMLGRYCPAMAQLTALVNQTNEWVADGVLSEEQAAALQAGVVAVIEGPPPPPPTTVLAMVGGSRHACGLTADGLAHCWGWNDSGQLGDGSTTDRHLPTPVAAPPGVTFASLHAVGRHTCGLTAAGAAYCWGNNNFGQLGDGTATERHTPTPVAPGMGLAFSTLGGGGGHTCGIALNGSVWCWGLNANGQLGNGTTVSSTPTQVHVPPGVQFVSISGAVWHTCALAADGEAYCWGGNDVGQLGDGTTIERHTPVQVAAPAGVRFVSLTPRCGQADDGTLYCWGLNFNGELGDGTTADRSSPAPVTMPAGVSFVSHHWGGSHTCALDAAGEAYCWGLNNFGQLGDGSTAQRTVPAAVAAPPGVTFVSLTPGAQFTCGLTPTDEAYCWGDNFNGQLGDGTTTGRHTPNRVVGWPSSP